ncbi:type III pantothenate kinase [Burkholderiales bacterium]|nr:type III pantothenate kinase [Burkholderiales bacterium]
MILVIDIGNTQVKWATTFGDVWATQGQCPLFDVDKLPLYWADLTVPEAIVISNVAGAEAEAAVEMAIRPWKIEPYWVAAKANQCGVINSYDKPSQLGPDRWAAVIGAKTLRMANVVMVCSGTATTIHGLTEDGVFIGGLIIPGYDLIHQSLGSNAAHLSDAEGQFSNFPVTTRDAITSGAIRATCKTIESFCDDMEASGHDDVKIILAGGAAAKIRDGFVRPVIQKDDVILLGLLEIAKSF